MFRISFLRLILTPTRSSQKPSNKVILAFFVDVTAHLLPLTKYFANGQYA